MAPPKLDLDIKPLVLLRKVQFEILAFHTEWIFSAALPLCPHEMKSSASMCRSTMPEKTNPAGHVHLILLLISGREEELGW